MDADFVEQEEISFTAALLAEDDGADVPAVFQTNPQVLMAMRRRAHAKRIARRRRYCGFSVGRRANNVGGSAHALVWILQRIARAPPHGASGDCAIPACRSIVERLAFTILRLQRPFRGEGNAKVLCAAKSQHSRLLFL